jgi:carbamoyltransferase
MKILGISAFYHDSAAAFLVDGKIMSAAQEERFTRIKSDSSFPENAIRFCVLKDGHPDVVVFYDKPFLKFERMLETYLSFAPKGFKNFLKAMPVWLNGKLNSRKLIQTELAKLGLENVPVMFSTHHLSHAASAFFPSPFDEAAILTVDGVGEWATATISHGKDGQINILKEQLFPHSIGLLYSAFTQFCGFKVNSGEYKLMGLAPYGDPMCPRVAEWKTIILDKLIKLYPDGSVWLDMEYFDFGFADSMINIEKWHLLFGIPPRKPETNLTQEYSDLALAIQQITEEAILRMAREAKRLTGARYLCLAGGVALNCVVNGQLIREKIFEDVWIQPAAGDAGGALGAALAYYYLGCSHPRKVDPLDSMSGSYLGPSWSDKNILKLVNLWEVPNSVYDEELLMEKVVDYLEQGKIVGWFQGSMEFGPRALGNRSILGDPRTPDMQKRMNLKIKFRESFRPFAPSILAHKAADVFLLGSSSPYMLTIDWIRSEQRKPLPDTFHDWPIDKRLIFERSEWPAITHMDFTARLQTVDGKFNSRYYKLISAFERKTGCPMVVNTSFNVRGEPIVCSPEDAYRCFHSTSMDVLVMGNVLMIKSEQPEHLPEDCESTLKGIHLD